MCLCVWLNHAAVGCITTDIRAYWSWKRWLCVSVGAVVAVVVVDDVVVVVLRFLVVLVVLLVLDDVDVDVDVDFVDVVDDDVVLKTFRAFHTPSAVVMAVKVRDDDDC